jgi:hypothetical protein
MRRRRLTGAVFRRARFNLPSWVTSPSFCTTASERVYITANGCESTASKSRSATFCPSPRQRSTLLHDLFSLYLEQESAIKSV